MESASIRVYINKKKNLKLSTLIDYLPEYDCGFAYGLLSFSEKACKRFIVEYIATECTIDPTKKEFWYQIIK